MADLDVEYEYFVYIKEKLVDNNEGKYALIRGKELIGIFDADNDAYKAGLEKFGNTPFL